MGTPEHADADGIFQCLLGILDGLDSNFDRNFLTRKPIAVGCDGVGVMKERKGENGDVPKNSFSCSPFYQLIIIS